jgi:hypothetical protein
MLLREVRRALVMFEEHELCEWFKYKGELVYDPHKDEKGKVD